MCRCKWRQLGPHFRSSGTVLLHVYMQMEVAVVSTSEVQGLYYCMCTCKWRQLWSLLQKFRDCNTACGHANGGSCGRYFRIQGLYYCMFTCKWKQLWSLLQKFRDCITVYMLMFRDCITTCEHANVGSCGLYFSCITACVHANVVSTSEGSCGLYFRSSGTVLLHVYMQMEVAVVSTSEVQGLYYCMCTCK